MRGVRPRFGEVREGRGVWETVLVPERRFERENPMFLENEKWSTCGQEDFWESAKWSTCGREDFLKSAKWSTCGLEDFLRRTKERLEGGSNVRVGKRGEGGRGKESEMGSAEVERGERRECRSF